MSIKHLLALAAALGGPLLATDLEAQPAAERTATLEGIVVDSVSGMPIEGVLVRLDTGAQAFSDRAGLFRLADLPAGSHTLALLTTDCRVRWVDVELEPGEVASARVELVAPASAVDSEREASERRRSNGRLVTAEEIERMNVSTLAQVVRRVEPSMVAGPAGYTGTPAQVRGRAANSIASGATEPVVVIDGVRVASPSRALVTLTPDEVELLEILPGAAGGWEFGSAGSSGVIRITTRRGGRSATAGGQSQPCNVTGFPGR